MQNMFCLKNDLPELFKFVFLTRYVENASEAKQFLSSCSLNADMKQDER